MTFKKFFPVLFAMLPMTVSAQSLTPASDRAVVHVVVYSSYACPYCATWAKTLETLIPSYVGQVSVQIQPFALDAGRERRVIATAAALATQGKFSALHRSLFDRTSGRVSEEAWRVMAAEAGVDLGRFDRDLDLLLSGPIDTGELARAHGVTMTPTTFVDGFRFDGLPSAETIDTVIRARLKSGVQLKSSVQPELPEAASITSPAAPIKESLR